MPVAGALYTTFEARGILNDYITRDYQTDNPYEAMLMAQEEESLKPINQKIAMHKSEREMALKGLRGELPVAIRTYCSDCSNSSSSRCPLPGIVPEL